ncbi:MAG: butyrate kinase [Caldisericales bacterium]|nr:butyrate kinase [Caldisericales bacterium]
MARVLVINPGSTSTKVAVFDDDKEVAQENITHSNEELARFSKTADQAPYRLKAIKDFLSRHSVPEESIECVVGRGGPVKPIPAGTYNVNGAMLADLVEAKRADHPSNLGGIIADMIRKERSIPAYIVDPVSVDEFEDFVRVAGFPECERASLGHALNIRAVSRRAAAELGIPFEKANFIVVHMGGGISVAPVQGGRIADYNNANEGGPMQPERSGGLPLASLVELCFTGKYTENDIKVMTTKKGGLYAYLGTNDVLGILEKIKNGDMETQLVFEAMLYQIAQEIGGMATSLKGKIDAIILTGSIAYSEYVVSRIREYTGYIAKVMAYGGQMEMEALAQGGLRVLRGAEKAKEY